jgi:hypothetical protein
MSLACAPRAARLRAETISSFFIGDLQKVPAWQSWRWVVEAGWQARDLASPMLTSRLKILRAS